LPVLDSSYSAPWWVKNPHFNTIIPNRLRKFEGFTFNRYRLSTPDGDFIDIDVAKASDKNQPTAAILVHGLEGSSSSNYIYGMAEALLPHQTDVFALNFRSCSGEPNLTVGSYHSGKTDDLGLLVQNIIEKGYTTIHIIGFSLGGNVSLLYAGQQGASMPKEVKNIVAISTPCHLASSVDVLHEKRNIIYLKRFIGQLKQKIDAKKELITQSGISINLDSIQNFYDFDNMYTAPAHGFKDASDYYESCSSLYQLENIAVPTLIINALDDTFLSEKCYPFEVAKNHEYVHLLAPKNGGHVGFIEQRPLRNIQWHEKQTLNFIHRKSGR
tara:strand:- start:1135 stop:2115 length:981 start_codon:yes stop_codon:yes gene_type:complete